MTVHGLSIDDLVHSTQGFRREPNRVEGSCFRHTNDRHGQGINYDDELIYIILNSDSFEGTLSD